MSLQKCYTSHQTAVCLLALAISAFHIWQLLLFRGHYCRVTGGYFASENSSGRDEQLKDAVD
jgi:hypothetical protein